MHQNQNHYFQKSGQFRHWQDRPERHSIAELARLDPGNHDATRLSGVLATLDRIGRLAMICDHD